MQELFVCVICRKEAVKTGRAQKYCRDCARSLAYQKTREWGKKNPEKKRAGVLRWKDNNRDRFLEINRKAHRRRKLEEAASARLRLYGLTDEQFQKKLSGQDNLCEICFSFLDRPHVDHDHRNNRVRGILCRSCNSVLGLAKENVEILSSAIKYIMKYGESTNV